MRLAYALLADAASVVGDGTFSILAADRVTISFHTFPALQPILAVVLKFEFADEDADKRYALRVEVVAPDGKLLVPPTTNGFRPQPRNERNAALAELPLAQGYVVNFPVLQFATPGKYVFRIVVDDQKMAQLPLYVLQDTQAEAPTDAGASPA